MRWSWVGRLAGAVLGLFVLIFFLVAINGLLASASTTTIVLTVAAGALAVLVLVALMLWSRETKISA